jgi:tetratricopeptide (TPR) repeat protein
MSSGAAGMMLLVLLHGNHRLSAAETPGTNQNQLSSPTTASLRGTEVNGVTAPVLSVTSTAAARATTDGPTTNLAVDAFLPAPVLSSVTNVLPPATPAASSNALGGKIPVGPPTPAMDEIAARLNAEVLRSYLRLQEQLHTALLAIQHSRAEASAEAQTNVSAMLGRLEFLEQQLAEQRSAEAASSRQTHRLMLLAAGGMFLIGILAMVLTAIIQARGMNRLAEIAMNVGAARGLPGLAVHPELAMGGKSPAALANGERLLLADADAQGGQGIAGSARLESIIRQLEGRIQEMEAATDGGRSKGPANEAERLATESAGSAADAAAPTPTSNLNRNLNLNSSFRAIVMAKAQALLNLGQPQAALNALEEALVRDPNDPELYLRRGMAFERLKRMEQALENFDRAITLDPRCTQAYLSKGGVLNQQARYQEALACYEQALEYRGRSA